MQTRMMNVVVAALACVVLVGCKNGGGSIFSSAEPVIILERVNGDSPALKELGTMHITTKSKYEALGDANIFPGEINFFEHDLVIVALGERNTGGYSVDIESIQKDGAELLVNGKVTTPAPDAATTQAITYPYTAVLVPNTGTDIIVPYID